MKKISAIAQTFIVTSFSALSLLAVAPVQAASFTGLGYAFPHGISADGSVVVGGSYINGKYEAFRWTQSGGMVSLGRLSSDDAFSEANGVSADGSVVVGNSVGINVYKAFRWTQSEGMVDLGGFPSSNDNEANGVSADGSVIVGKSARPNGSEAARWTQTEGIIGLGTLPSLFARFSEAKGVSADGSVIVGDDRWQQAFRWTQSGGMVGLGYLTGDYRSEAKGVSADGSVIVGSSSNNDGVEAFRWTQESGMVGLGFLDSSNIYSEANGVSADGSVVVGYSGTGSGFFGINNAFRWTQSSGMVNLKDQLTGFGLNLSGWQLVNAMGVSADGFTIVGNGINPSGQGEAWIANLSPEPVPEPLTILGSMAAIAFAAGFERKFSKNKSDEKDPDT
jgi:probable HAF family extracellular repeat protein